MHTLTSGIACSVRPGEHSAPPHTHAQCVHHRLLSICVRDPSPRAFTHSTAPPTRCALAASLAAARPCHTLLGPGHRGRFHPRLTHHRIYFDRRMGSSAQLSALARLALAAPAFWPHAGKLEPRWHGQPQGQVQRHHHDGSVRNHVVDRPHTSLGTLAGMQLHGCRTGVAVVQTRALCARRSQPLNPAQYKQPPSLLRPVHQANHSPCGFTSSLFFTTTTQWCAYRKMAHSKHTCAPDA